MYDFGKVMFHRIVRNQCLFPVPKLFKSILLNTDDFLFSTISRFNLHDIVPVSFVGSFRFDIG